MKPGEEEIKVLKPILHTNILSTGRAKIKYISVYTRIIYDCTAKSNFTDKLIHMIFDMSAIII